MAHEHPEGESTAAGKHRDDESAKLAPQQVINESFEKGAGRDPALFRTRSGLTAKQAATIFLGIIATLLVGYTLRVLGPLIVPLLVAFFLSFLLWPLISWLIKRRVPGGVAVMLALLVVLGVVTLCGLIVQQSFRGFVQQAPKYEQRLKSWANRVTTQLGPFAEELQKREHLEKVGAAAADTALGAVGTVVTTLSSLALILIYLLFILTGRLTAGDRIGRAFHPERAEKVRQALHNVDHQVMRYLGMKTLINIATGILFGVTSAALGIDFPILWGFLGFLISYVPTIGSVISPLPPILLALLQYPDELWRPVALAIALVCIVVVMFNLVEPKLMGDSLGLSPVVVMFALLFFGWMWGVWGMILSVPLAAIVKIICENFEATKPLAVFME